MRADVVRVGAMVVAVLGLVVFLRRQDAPEPEPIAFEPLEPALFGGPHAVAEAWADVDLDGDPDRFVGFTEGPARLYLNEPAGFRDAAPELGLAVERSARTAAWGDYDGDGDPDLLLGWAGEAPVTALFRNDRAAGFTEVAAEAGVRVESGATRQASWIDYDGDGDLDLFLALRDAPNRLFRNAGAVGGAGPVFEDVGAGLGLDDPRRSVGAVWFDLDEDGDLDVVTANMDGDENGVWRNEGDHFVDVAGPLGLAEGGRGSGDPAHGTVRPCVVDFDRDGHLDLFFANYGPNGLFRNPGGSGLWSDVAPAMGLAVDSRYDTCAWADMDHDGLQDLFVNGTVTGGVSYRDWLLRREDGAFVDVTPASLLELAADHGATWVDFDSDGDLDLSVVGVGDDGMHYLLENLLRPEAASASLRIRLVDADGRATLPGAEVRVYAADSDRLLGTRLVDTGSSYDAQSDLPVHLAVRVGQIVDVEVTLAAGGRRLTDRLTGVDAAAYRGRVLELRVGRDGRIVSDR